MYVIEGKVGVYEAMGSPRLSIPRLGSAVMVAAGFPLCSPAIEGEIHPLVRSGREGKRLSKNGFSKDPGQFRRTYNSPPRPVPQPSTTLKAS